MEHIEEYHFTFPGVRKCMITTGGAYLELTGLIVEPAFRGKGVGKAAVEEIKRYARNHRYRGVRLIAMPIGPVEERVTLEQLVRFYKRNGFQLLRGTDDQMICYV